MKLSEYYKMIREVDHLPPLEDDPRITVKDLSFNGGPGEQGSATITFLDGEPIHLNWYIWSLDYNWMISQVEKELGHKIKLSNFNGGNGHESADLEIITETINFYSKGDEYGFMSNFAHYEVKIKNITYKTSEHYYQSQKYKDTQWESKVCNASGAMEAARIGRDKAGPLRQDWDSVKDDVMREVVEAKFRQHPELAKKLLRTGDAKLVEHTENDSYWADGGNGTGKNMLGIILMEVRAKLKAELQK